MSASASARTGERHSSRETTNEVKSAALEPSVLAGVEEDGDDVEEVEDDDDDDDEDEDDDDDNDAADDEDAGTDGAAQ